MKETRQFPVLLAAYFIGIVVGTGTAPEGIQWGWILGGAGALTVLSSISDALLRRETDGPNS